MAGRAIALPEFNLVGQKIHYAIPYLLHEISTRMFSIVLNLIK